MPAVRPTDWLDPDYTAVYRERALRTRKITEDDAWQKAHTYYSTHPLEWIEHWCMTYDPRKVNEGTAPYVPFVLFDKQREFILWLHDRFEGKKNGVVEKSRDAGASWLCLAYSLWLWLYRPGVSIGFGSNKRENVDNLDDPDSLLEKFRIMVRALPAPMVPPGFDMSKHGTSFKITNPVNKANVTGQGGKNVGRGGRKSIFFVDEAAHLEFAEAVEAAIGNNTDVRIDVSTPNGRGNPFYTKRFSGVVSVFTFHWYDDPRKDQDWYDRKKLEYTDQKIFAQEIDLDYESSGSESVIPAGWVRSSRQLRKWFEQEGKLPSADRFEKVAGLDVGGSQANTSFCSRQGPIVSRSVSWRKDDTTDNAHRAANLAIESGCHRLNFDSVGIGKGVASTLKRVSRETGLPCIGIAVGRPASNKKWPDGIRAKDRFQNHKAEIWWEARDGIRKAHEYWLWVQNPEHGIEHPVEELCLLPDDDKMCSQLSLPGVVYLSGNKVGVETKKQLKSRGVASPDEAESLILTFSPRKGAVTVARATGMA